MTKKPTPKEIEGALRELARPGALPRTIMKAVKKRFPDASKKDIIHAAFNVMVNDADKDIDRALTLQNFALQERTGQDE